MQNSLPAPHCRQRLWFSFFFDGTGNNLQADLGTNEHSNVARLYRSHSGEAYTGSEKTADPTVRQIFRIYIPGVGTYFREVNDKGGTTQGGAVGDEGDARISWALDQFRLLMKRPLADAAVNKAYAIDEVNIAVFGFSRGAAAARAFANDFVSSMCTRMPERKLQLKEGKWPVRIRFIGLFDTVASVGPGASANNISTMEMKSPIAVKLATRASTFGDTRPVVIAFAPNGVPGADPSPGKYDGHSAWGGRLRIPDEVEQVRHFVAAHEFRNSFPVDSIHTIDPTTGIPNVRANFFEYVHAGVHSDVGGGYRPGEDGKSLKPEAKLSLLHLWSMLEHAVKAGVPFRAPSAWGTPNNDDYRTVSELMSSYQYYLEKVSVKRQSVGDFVCAHMALYYQWRFRVIKQKRLGKSDEAERIKKNSSSFAKEQKDQDATVALLSQEYLRAREYSEHLLSQKIGTGFIQLRSVYLEAKKKHDEAVKLARHAEFRALHAKRKAQARVATLPKEKDLQANIDLYDEQLMLDAQSIHDLITPSPLRNAKAASEAKKMLRPHYRALVEAYDSEFIKDKGLSDSKLIEFFDSYIHNSLAGFGKDATLPSDPRIIYAGDDFRLPFANIPARSKSASFLS